jgi:hypothetical protein
MGQHHVINITFAKIDPREPGASDPSVDPDLAAQIAEQKQRLLGTTRKTEMWQ